jgi:hypothetical protein
MNGELIPYEEWETNKKHYLDDCDCHSHSFLTLKELLDFDYSQKFENRRTSKTTLSSNGGSVTDGAALANDGEGKITSYRDFLGAGFFQDLAQLQIMGAPDEVRIVFWFDN